MTAEFLEKAAKRRTLRPALPLKEIEKLSKVSNRPTKVYSKAKVLIVEFGEDYRTSVETAASVFRAQNSRNEVTTSSFNGLSADLDKLLKSKRDDESEDRKAREREEDLKMLLQNKIADSYNKWKTRREKLERQSDVDYDSYWEEDYEIARQHEATFLTKTDEQRLSVFYKEEPEMKNELKELTEKIEKWKNERKPLIEKQIKQKEEELKKEIEKLEMTVLSVIDEWIEVLPNDKGSVS